MLAFRSDNRNDPTAGAPPACDQLVRWGTSCRSSQAVGLAGEPTVG